MASIERRTEVTRARLLALLFPRRCPFCGALLGADAVQGTVCPACLPEEMRLQHLPPRLPEGEHAFYALGEAAAAYYYADAVRGAVKKLQDAGVRVLGSVLTRYDMKKALKGSSYAYSYAYNYNYAYEKQKADVTE